MLEVVAAIIRQDNKILICQRPDNKLYPLLWEFPGGKVEKGETLEQALERECLEELDVVLKVGAKYEEISYSYPEFKVHLTFFEGEILTGELCCKEHNKIAWVDKESLPEYDFCAADLDLIKRLAQA